ncbi:MAG: hypothetical protein KJI69_05715 [Patescibacteria group bacterium]|nr:hypothetical protein [Patescibacteria group bacterium]
MAFCIDCRPRIKEVLTYIMAQNKPWYRSQTKVGVVLLAGSAILATVGSWLTGSIDMTSAVVALFAEVGALKLAFGIRDWPVINRR